MNWINRHRETLFVALAGFIVIVALNAMMLHYHYDLWIRPKVGFWTSFWDNFEVSGFDPYAYIVVSKWRPLYILPRHPLLAVMLWPLSLLNEWLSDVTDINCAIFIIASLWIVVNTISWTLMYKIHRHIMELSFANSLLLSAFFFSFSHVMMITFVCDHMALTLPCLLLAIYIAGKAIKQQRTIPLWQSLPLLFLSTGITTTNMIKVGIADFVAMLHRGRWNKVLCHFLWYLIPLSIIGALYLYQERTSQEEERNSIKHTVEVRMQRDSTFAEYWRKSTKESEEIKKQQIVHLSIATNTEYHIDRIPSLVENVFGEGFILHRKHALEDANRKRPVLVRYDNWCYYALETSIIMLFLAGVWYGRREPLVWMTMLMFLFDMLLHVVLNFASADVYIMTAHWAFVIPIAIACLFKRVRNAKLEFTLQSLLLFLTLFLWVHNMTIIANHIL